MTASSGSGLRLWSSHYQCLPALTCKFFRRNPFWWLFQFLNVIKQDFLSCPGVVVYCVCLWAELEDLEPFEQGQCGGSAFALSSGSLHRHQFCGGRSWQFIKTGGGERGGRGRCSVLAHADLWDQVCPRPTHTPHCFEEHVLHRQVVHTGRDLIKQTAITGGYRLGLSVAHLSETETQLLQQSQTKSHLLCTKGMRFPLLTLSHKLCYSWIPKWSKFIFSQNLTNNTP